MLLRQVLEHLVLSWERATSTVSTPRTSSNGAPIALSHVAVTRCTVSPQIGQATERGSRASGDMALVLVVSVGAVAEYEADDLV